MATKKLTVDPKMIDTGVKQLEELLKQYESCYKRVRLDMELLMLDSQQMAAVKQAADALEKQFQTMKQYLEGGVIDIFKTASAEYKAADAVK